LNAILFDICVKLSNINTFALGWGRCTWHSRRNAGYRSSNHGKPASTPLAEKIRGIFFFKKISRNFPRHYTTNYHASAVSTFPDQKYMHALNIKPLIHDQKYIFSA
jgi:hypothetical protein